MGSSTSPIYRANGWYIVGATQSLLLFLQEESNSSCQTLRYCVTHHNTRVLLNDRKLATSQIFRVICQKKILFVFIHLPVTLLPCLSQPTAEILLALTQTICSSFSAHFSPVIFCRYCLQIMFSRWISFFLLLTIPGFVPGNQHN